jgi:asparagine synthase (glutamine-hydrolysing)
MCGIAGYFSPSGFFSPEDLMLANRVMQHRGPDAHAIHSDETIGLAHRRLSIIDLSTGANQPMNSASGKSCIVYNGEVYNYKEIEKKLIISRGGNYQPKTSSDTELVLEAMETWGSKAVHELNGMFAFAWYNRAEKNLKIFRDRLGVKPLYYYWDGNNLFFASELKVFKALRKKLNLSIDSSAVTSFFHAGYIGGEKSIYSNVLKLLPGSSLDIKVGQLVKENYWNIEDKIQNQVLNDRDEINHTLKSLLESSVHYRMISDVPFGTFLSGGIDSSLVTAIAAQHTGNKKLNTFSIGFNEAAINESEYAAEVAKFLGTNHHAFTVTEKDALEIVPLLSNIYDEPYADSSAIPTLLVSKLAKQHVTMVLSGDGGDELFHGYGAHLWANRMRNSWLKYGKTFLSPLLKLGDSRKKRIGYLFENPKIGQWQDHIFSQEQYLFTNREIAGLMKQADFQAMKNLLQGKEPRKLTPAEWQSLHDLQNYLPDDLLVKVDRASMYYSLEAREPLLDYRLVEFAFNLPPELKINRLIQKYILKEQLYQYIPEKYFQRKKQGFSIPLNKWLKNELKPLLHHYTDEGLTEKFGWLNAAAVSQLKKRYLSGKEDFLYNRMWLIICFHQFLENEG